MIPLFNERSAAEKHGSTFAAALGAITVNGPARFEAIALNAAITARPALHGTIAD